MWRAKTRPRVSHQLTIANDYAPNLGLTWILISGPFSKLPFSDSPSGSTPKSPPLTGLKQRGRIGYASHSTGIRHFISANNDKPNATNPMTVLSQCQFDHRLNSDGKPSTPTDPDAKLALAFLK